MNPPGIPAMLPFFYFFFFLILDLFFSFSLPMIPPMIFKFHLLVYYNNLILEINYSKIFGRPTAARIRQHIQQKKCIKKQKKRTE